MTLFLAGALKMAELSAQAASAALPGEPGVGWLELRNKLEAFGAFRNARGAAGLPSAISAPLADQAEQAGGRDPYAALWITEGLGHAWAAHPGAGSLAGAAGLPGRALLPLHTGASLALAERLLGELARAPETAAAAVLRDWRERSAAALRPGYAGLAVEAAGLVVRSLEPWRMGRLAALLGADDPALAELFWHGAGRGLYFAPVHLLPTRGALRRAFASAWSEPGDEPGRRNATAGLAWALTLVNVRHPEVVAAALDELPDARAPGAAFAAGTTAALLLWASWAGLDPCLACFLAHAPAPPERARRWGLLVVEPSRRALSHLDSFLARRERLAELFRHRGMPWMP